jgi:hypothetical protein
LVLDELRFRDRRGVRLTVQGRVDDLERFVQKAIEARGLRVSSAVEARLRMERGGFGDGVRKLVGGVLYLALAVGFAFLSAYVTCVIAGTPFP